MNRLRNDLLTTAVVGLSALVTACGGGGGGGSDSAVLSTFSPSFALRQDVQLGSGNVTDAKVVDLNGDGIDDLIETDYFDKTVSAALGNPDGSFTTLFKLNTPSTPWAMELGDFDADGAQDLAVICISNNGGLPSLTVYRGFGDGSFAQAANFILPGDPSALNSGIVAGVSRDNIFVVIPSEEEVWQLEFDGADTLTDMHHFLVSVPGDFAPITVAIIDADGDTNQDVVVGELSKLPLGSDRIVMHISNGVGGFAAPATLAPVASYPIVENAGDIDGDSFDDLSVAQVESDRAQFFLGSNTGLGNAAEIQFSGVTSSILFVDLNGDGLKDVAATLIDESAIGVRMATAPASFGPLDLYNVGELPRAIGAGVFGSDLELDLFCSNTRDVSILRGDGAGKFRGATGYPVGAEPQFVRVVDMDADGILDAVSIDQYQNKVVFMKGMGDGSFQNTGQVPLAAASVEVPGYLQIHDFDEDGRPDVATTVHSTGEFRLIRNRGSLPFKAPLIPDSTPVGTEPLGFDAGDLDGDGHLDVVIANSGDNTLQVLMGAGDGTFSARTAINTPARPIIVLIEDLNADGHLDVAAATGDTDGSNTFLFMYAGDGTGNLTLTGQQVLPQLTTVLNTGDFNEDGFPDLAASQPQVSSDEVLVMLNNGGFSFSLTTVQVGFRMGTLEVFDINRDSHLDLVVPLRDGALVLALGDGTGQFPTVLPPGGEQFPAPYRVTASSLADLNGDNLPDLLMVSPSTPHLWVALNDGSMF